MAYGNLVSSGNRLAENALATLCDSFKEKLKCPSVGYPAIMKFALCMEKHGITRGLKNDSSIETALYIFSISDRNHSESLSRTILQTRM